MIPSKPVSIVLAIVIVIALLGLLHFKPWQNLSGRVGGEGSSSERESLAVGFLPVT